MCISKEVNGYLESAGVVLYLSHCNCKNLGDFFGGSNKTKQSFSHSVKYLDGQIEMLDFKTDSTLILSLFSFILFSHSGFECSSDGAIRR